MNAPLVLVTRPASAGDGFSTAFAGLGCAVRAVPTGEIEPVAPGGRLDVACSRLADYDWVVLTSPNGVRALIGAFERGSADRPLPSRPPRWAAVGPATAEALAAENVPVDVIPGRSTGTALVGALVILGPLHGSRVLLARSLSADDTVPNLLRLAGATVDEVEAYRTLEAPPSSLGGFADALDDPALIAIAVASGSAIRGVVRLARQTGRLERLRSVAIVSIGPSTSAAARELGLQPAAEA